MVKYKKVYVFSRQVFTRAVVRALIGGGGCIFIYSGSARLVSFETRRLQRRSLRLPTRSKSVQTGYLCTTAQAGADPGIFVCRSKFPGLKVGRRS